VQWLQRPSASKVISGSVVDMTQRVHTRRLPSSHSAGGVSSGVGMLSGFISSELNFGSIRVID
jgi:hypothetical protein